MNRETLTLCYAGVHSVLARCGESGVDYGVDTCAVGRRKLVGRQEDMIVDIALDIRGEAGVVGQDDRVQVA